MPSTARNARASSGTSISPVAKLLKRKRPASRPRAARLDSGFGKRIRIIAIVYPPSRHPGKALHLLRNSKLHVAENLHAAASPHAHERDQLPVRRSRWRPHLRSDFALLDQVGKQRILVLIEPQP